MFLVTELGGENLFDHSTRMAEQEGGAGWWTIPRLRLAARQITQALCFIHSLSLIHSDLKPENIVMRSLEPVVVKVIDFGSSCFIHDHLGTYVCSRSYRAPEVVIAAPYSYKIDTWSLGTILAELATGSVLFENDCVPTMLARMAAVLGPFSKHSEFLASGREANKYFTDQMEVYTTLADSGEAVIVTPVPTSLAARLGPAFAADSELVHFLLSLLQVNPAERRSSAEALAHPWLAERDEPAPAARDPPPLPSGAAIAKARRGKGEAKAADETEEAEEQPEKVDEKLAKEGAGHGDGGELGAEAIRQQVAAAVEDGLAAIEAAP